MEFKINVKINVQITDELGLNELSLYKFKE